MIDEDLYFCQSSPSDPGKASKHWLSIPVWILCARNRTAKIRNLVINCDHKNLILANSAKEELNEARAGFPFLVHLWILGPNKTRAGKMARAGIWDPIYIQCHTLYSLPLSCKKIGKLMKTHWAYVTTHQMGWILSPLKVISSSSILPHLNENSGPIYWVF